MELEPFYWKCSILHIDDFFLEFYLPVNILYGKGYTQNTRNKDDDCKANLPNKNNKLVFNTKIDRKPLIHTQRSLISGVIMR